jgi:hypothetical protein
MFVRLFLTLLPVFELNFCGGPSTQVTFGLPRRALNG